MNDQDVAHILVPVLGLAVVFFITLLSERGSGHDGISWRSISDFSVHLTVLSLGATGALFVIDQGHANDDLLVPLNAIVCVMLNIVLAVALAWRRMAAWRSKSSATLSGCFPDLFLGLSALAQTYAFSALS